MNNQENLKEIAYDVFVYAYPLLEQVKTINGMMEYIGLGFNKPVFSRTLPWESVGQPIVCPNLTSMREHNKPGANLIAPFDIIF